MPEDRVSDAEGPDPLEERFQDVEDDFTAKIADVRQRIVQMKMEIDEKASAEHEHEALEERLEDVEADLDAVDPVNPDTVEGLERAVEGHGETLETQAETIDGLSGGIEDLREKVGMLASASVDVQDRLDELEDRLEEHAETVGDIEEKLDMVASSSVDVQDRLETLAGRASERDALGRLREAANRERVRRARCGACRTRLDVGLLSAPACPDCGADFVDVESGGFLRRGRLVTESRPVAGGGDAAAAEGDAGNDAVVPDGADDRSG